MSRKKLQSGGRASPFTTQPGKECNVEKLGNGCLEMVLQAPKACTINLAWIMHPN